MSILGFMDFWERIDPLAAELGVSVEARRKWRERAIVPAYLHLKLLRLAPEREIPLSEEELLSTTSAGRG